MHSPNSMAFRVSYSSPRMTQLCAWENPISPPIPETRTRNRLPTSNFCYFGLDILHQFHGDDKPNRYEAWSPNCTYIPSYQGVPPSLCDLETAAAAGLLPLFDGSLGGFDYRFFPQALNDDNVELSFIPKTERNGVEWQFLGHLCELVAADKFHLTHTGLGKLVDRAKELELERVQILQNLEPVILCKTNRRNWSESPTESELMSQFSSPLPWETLVARFAAVQRKLVHKAAFSEYHKAFINNDSAPGMQNIPRAGNSIGCWANGLSQENLDLLLRWEVPVFFLHRYVPGVDYPPSPGSGYCSADYRQNRERRGLHYDEERTVLEQNQYDKLARLSHCVLLTTYSTILPHRPILEHGSSCGSWQNGHKRSPSEAYDSLSSSQNQPYVSRPFSLCTSWNDNEDDPPLPTLYGTLPDRTAKPRPPPPPIQSVPHSRQWVKFVDNGLHPLSSPMERTFSKAGYRYRPPLDSEFEIWFDRENCRMFYFLDRELNDIDPMEPDGTDEFGRPWPDFALLPIGTGRPTKWLYSTKDPRSYKRNLPNFHSIQDRPSYAALPVNPTLMDGTSSTLRGIPS